MDLCWTQIIFLYTSTIAMLNRMDLCWMLSIYHCTIFSAPSSMWWIAQSSLERGHVHVESDVLWDIGNELARESIARFIHTSTGYHVYTEWDKVFFCCRTKESMKFLPWRNHTCSVNSDIRKRIESSLIQVPSTQHIHPQSPQPSWSLSPWTQSLVRTSTSLPTHSLTHCLSCSPRIHCPMNEELPIYFREYQSWK